MATSQIRTHGNQIKDKQTKRLNEPKPGIRAERESNETALRERSWQRNGS